MTERQILKIIVFEDDQLTAQLLKKLLNSFGHAVIIHSNPLSCPIFSSSTNKCPKASPCADVILSDIVMPGMNGIEFLKFQKDRGCKILDEYKALMSATVTHEQETTIGALGFKFFNKPFKTLNIIEWLNECSMKKVEVDFKH